MWSRLHAFFETHFLLKENSHHALANCFHHYF